MRVAVVGAGVSGLVVAHLLHRAHEITVFEANGYAGGHTNTVRVDTPNETHHVDTGFIVFNDRNYPNFERLLERLGVGWQPSAMTFSVSDEIGDFEYSGAFAERPVREARALAHPVVPPDGGRPGALQPRRAKAVARPRATVPRSGSGSRSAGSRVRSSTG